MSRPDLVLFYGTRPQVIKACLLRSALASRLTLVSVDTGQHYDYALNALLYQQLGVVAPDRFLEVGSGGHGEQTGRILERGEELLRELRPRLVAVIGDTNSTLGGALAATKLRIPVVHIEAGMRASDGLMAEEVNRRAVDAISDVLCAPSASAARRLERERPEAVIVQTGDVAYDGFCQRMRALSTLEPTQTPYVFATLHRAELTDRPDLLREVMGALRALPLRVFMTLHPRTSQALDRAGVPSGDDHLRLMPPVGYLESLALIKGAAVIVTDSGGVQREAYWSRVPCVTLRSETEWVETVECGANVLVDPSRAFRELADAVATQARARSEADGWDVTAYGRGDAAVRIAQAIDDFLSRRVS